MLNKSEYRELLKYQTVADCDIENTVVQALYEQGFVAGYEYTTDNSGKNCSQILLCPKNLIITKEGKNALNEYDRIRQRKSHAKRKKAAKVGYDIFLLLVGAVIALCAQNFSAIIEWVGELFY